MKTRKDDLISTQYMSVNTTSGVPEVRHYPTNRLKQSHPWKRQRSVSMLRLIRTIYDTDDDDVFCRILLPTYEQPIVRIVQDTNSPPIVRRGEGRQCVLQDSPEAHLGTAIPGSRIPAAFLNPESRDCRRPNPGISGLKTYLLNCLLNTNFCHKKNLFANNNKNNNNKKKKMTPVAVRSPGPYCIVTLAYV